MKGKDAAEKSLINIPAMPNVQNRQPLLSIIYFVDDAIIANSYPPAFSPCQFLTALGPWLL
jgi:hypothetical protein